METIRQGHIQNDHDWYDTPVGRYVREREKRLILDLTLPREGETILGVGLGTHENLLIFRNEGCSVTGIEQSPQMGDRATCTLERQADIHPGRATDLPFSDDEFDVVALIAALEFAEDPQRAIAEAIRVCRGRVFLGVMNKYSFASVHRRISCYNQARSFHLAELLGMVRNQLQKASIQWGSVLFLPLGWYKFAAALEEAIPVMKNPFGAFFGLSFPVNYTYRTVQDPISDTLHFRADTGRPVPGAIRETKHARSNAL